MIGFERCVGFEVEEVLFLVFGFIKQFYFLGVDLQSIAECSL
ncbi:unnamed protein product [Acidithrix sp. C25]|nr:unnamed protein product [Acidithrix sp. C25]